MKTSIEAWEMLLLYGKNESMDAGLLFFRLSASYGPAPCQAQRSPQQFQRFGREILHFDSAGKRVGTALPVAKDQTSVVC